MNFFSDTGHVATNDVFYYQWGYGDVGSSVRVAGPSVSDYESLPMPGSLVQHPYGSLLHGYVNCCELTVINNGPFGPYEFSWTRDDSSPSEAWRFLGTASSSGLGDNPKLIAATLRCIQDSE